MEFKETEFVKAVKVVPGIYPADGARTAAHRYRLSLCPATKITYPLQQFAATNPGGSKKYIVTIY